MAESADTSAIPTAYFGTILTNGVIEDNGETVGVVIPSNVTPGAQLICLRTDLLERLRTEPAAAGDSDA